MQKILEAVYSETKRLTLALSFLLGFLALGQSQASALQSVTLAWDPSPDPTVVGYYVHYGATSGSYSTKLDVGNVTSATIPNLTEGVTYYFAVTAYDSSALESEPSNEVSYNVPQAPSITLTAPANGASFGTPATVNLSASVVANGHTITQVQFYNGSSLVGTSTSSPYTYSWNGVSAGSYTVFARVTYDTGSTVDSASSTITVTTLAPAITLTAPANGASFLSPATLNLAADVATNGHTITLVTFYNGTSPLGTDAQPPYTLAWGNVAAGSYNLKARVTYDSGSIVDSAVATITVTNPLPSISLAGPANGATFSAPATVAISANVTANGHSISQVQFYNGSTLLGGDTTSPYSFSWTSVAAGTYTVKAKVTYDGGSTLESAVATITVTNPPPTIVLLTPTNNASFNAPAAISCSAGVNLNGHTLTKVQFFNNLNLLGQVSSAPYTVTWTCTNSGYYNITARLIYDSGSTVDSASATVQVNPAQVNNVHVITVAGAGTVTPDVTSDSLVLGNRYTVTAVPDDGQQFAGWDGSMVSTNTTISFLMTPGFHLQAHFIPWPNGGVAASYYGLFYDPEQVQQASSGSFTLTTTKRGTYSGYLQMGKTRVPFRGLLDPQGNGTNTLVCPDHTTLALQFSLTNGQPGDQVQGTLTAVNWEATLLGDRAVFSTKTNPAPLKGAYTLVIPGTGSSDPTLPFGHSFGIVTVDPAGRVRLTGTLADGTKLTQSAPLSARGYWGLYAPLYAGQGSVLSWLAFTNRPTDDFNGPLSWIKPAGSKAKYYAAGFTNDCQVFGSTFTPLAATSGLGLSTTIATMSFSGGSLSADFTNSLLQTASGRVNNISDNRLSVSVARNNGGFRGSVTDPSTGKSLPYSGVLFQKTQTGYGFLLNQGQSSQVQLGE